METNAKHAASAIVVWIAAASFGVAAAQKSTELFIPIGQSPELSNELTVMGTIVSVDAERRSIVVSSDGAEATATVVEGTRIYIDRSKLARTNGYGSFEDLTEGARVEVLYEGRARASEGPAEWIKVEVVSAPER